MKLERNFRFRETRDYLHSTSLFDDLLQVRGAGATRIDMKFHRRTSQQVSYVDTPPDPGTEPVAEWRDDAGRLYVVDRDEPIRDASPYDEPGLASMLALDDKTVELPALTPGFTRFEAMVTGFKSLLQSTRGVRGCKYVFVRLQLKHYPYDTALSISYSRNIGSFFQGDISVQDKPLGQIFFGEWR